MAKFTDESRTVLTLLRALHGLGGMPVDQAMLGWFAISSMGVEGFGPEDGPFNLKLGVALNRLLRHANADPDAMFEATAADLVTLGLDIDKEKFDEIVRRIDEDNGSI